MIYRMSWMLILVCLLLTGVRTSGAVPAQQTAPAPIDVLARINAWRLDNDLSPLVFNDTLSQMAQDQAAYISTFAEIPEGGKIHIGTEGEFPRERANFPQYAWTSYGLSSQILVGENAAVSGLDYAMNFWSNSRIHREAMSNPSYREIGIGVLPHQFGALIIVVFGGRPNVLPAMVSPDGLSLYLTNDTYEFGEADRVQNVTQYQILDSDGNPVYDDWQPWRIEVPLPFGLEDGFTVLYSDGSSEVRYEVAPTTDFVILPETIDVTAIELPSAPANQTAESETLAVSLTQHPQSFALELDPVARDTIARINEYRIAQGVAPLVPNPILSQMAQDQAAYISTFSEIPEGGKIHIGRNGEFPPERAVYPNYNWVSYGTGDQILLSENAAVANLNYAMDFWANSAIHARTMGNPSYREIGVGVLPHPFGNLIFVVFGGRPDVYTAQVSADGSRVYLSNDYYEFGAVERLREAVFVQIYDQAGNPVFDNLQAWQPSLAIPNTIGSPFTVAYSDGEHEIRVEVDAGLDYVLTRETLDRVPDSLVASPIESGVDVALAESTSPEAFDQAPAEDTATIGVEAEPTEEAVAAATPEPTAEPVAEVATVEPTPNVAVQAEPSGAVVPVTPVEETITPGLKLRVIYDEQSLTIINVSGENLNVQEVFFSGDRVTLDLAFMVGFSNILPTNFPADRCIQIWTWDETDFIAPPIECPIRAGIFTTDPENKFWVEFPFTVTWGERPVAICPPNEGVCDIIYSE